jgi:AcrR family transcriptional regulator
MKGKAVKKTETAATVPPPSIWLRPERSARGPVPEHSRAELAQAGIALADGGGLSAVTMRSVAAAVGAAPASLYRYVRTRDEVIELMQDEVGGEFSFAGPVSGEPVADLVRLAHQARAIYLRHPWLLDVPSAVGVPGPNAVRFVEYVLAVLDGTGLGGPARLETVAIFTGIVRLLVGTEVDQQRAGQEMAEWQGALTGYLFGIAADGRHPYLAAALAGQASGTPQADGARQADRVRQPDGADGADGASRAPGTTEPSLPVFDRTLTRILTGLL